MRFEWFIWSLLIGIWEIIVVPRVLFLPSFPTLLTIGICESMENRIQPAHHGH